jgi:hypothetical protein
MISALIIACWVMLTTAVSFDEPPRPVETLLVDTRVPVLVGENWVIMSREEHRRYLARRAYSETTATVTSTSTDGTVEVTTTVPVDFSTTTSTATTTTIYASSPLPSPFDQAMAANYTDQDKTSCPSFISSLLGNSTFKSCYAFSMLVQVRATFRKKKNPNGAGFWHGAHHD